VLLENAERITERGTERKIGRNMVKDAVPVVSTSLSVRRSTAKVLASAKFITLNSYPLPLGLGLDIYNDYTR